MKECFNQIKKRKKSVYKINKKKVIRFKNMFKTRNTIHNNSISPDIYQVLV